MTALSVDVGVSAPDEIRCDVYVGSDGQVSSAVKFCGVTVHGMTVAELRRLAAAFTEAADQRQALVDRANRAVALGVRADTEGIQ